MNKVPVDRLGNEIRVGDKIVYATKGSSNARLQVGIVKRIYESEERHFAWASGKYVSAAITKLSVEVGDTYSKIVTLSKLNRVVVVNSVKPEIPREYLSEYGKFVLDSQSGE